MSDDQTTERLKRENRGTPSAKPIERRIILPETDCEGARVVAERLRIKVGQNVIKVQGQQVRITANFGITDFDAENLYEKISFEKMIRLSDKCIYQAKRKGRNRVEVEKV